MITDVVDACHGMCELAVAAREEIIDLRQQQSICTYYLMVPREQLAQLEEKLTLIHYTGLEVLRLQARTELEAAP